MKVSKIVLILILAGASSATLAQSGTPEEQAACRPDVRRFCGNLPPGADNSEYLKCLEVHRDDLSKKCHAVLADHGR